MALIISICRVCGDAIAASVEICYACDASGTDATASAARSAGDLNDAPTVLTVRDFAALERFARLRLQPESPAARGLLEKLDRARIVRTEAVAASTATLGSRVVFSVEGSQPEARVLVLPTQHVAAGWTLPVTAPRGMALLGRAAGAAVSVARHDGGTECLRLHAVAQLPEAAAGHAAAPGSGAAPAARPILYRSLARA